MEDLRQSLSYVEYIKSLGWGVDNINGVNCFSKKIPIIGSVTKIQRQEKIVTGGELLSIVKENRSFVVCVEPKNDKQTKYYLKNGFKKTKSPSLPSKTIHFNLSPFAENHGRESVDECGEISASEGFRSRRSAGRRYLGREPEGASLKSEKRLLAAMHQKPRYNIGLSKRRGVKVVKSGDIEKFAGFWQRCAKRRGMFLSQKREIKAIFKAFKRNAIILNALPPPSRKTSDVGLGMKMKQFPLLRDFAPDETQGKDTPGVGSRELHSNEVVAAVLILFTKDTAYYMYAASTQKGNKLFAPTLLVWEAMRFSKKVGAKVFDFEGIYDERFPLKSWKGFTRFKKGFGGKEVEYPEPLRRYFLPFKLW